MYKESAKAELIGAGIGALGNVLRKKLKGEDVSFKDVVKGAAVGAGGTALAKRLPRAIKASRGKLSTKELEHVKKGKSESVLVGAAALPERMVRKHLMKRKIRKGLAKTITDSKELKKATKKEYKKQVKQWNADADAGTRSKSLAHTVFKKGVIDPLSKADIRSGRFIKGLAGEGKVGKHVSKLFDHDGVASGLGPAAKVVKYGLPAYVGAHAYKDIKDFSKKKELEKNSSAVSQVAKRLLELKKAHPLIARTGLAAAAIKAKLKGKGTLAMLPVSMYATHKLTGDYKKHLAPKLEKKLIDSGILYKDVEDEPMAKSSAVIALRSELLMRKTASDSASKDKTIADLKSRLDEFEKNAIAEQFLIELVEDKSVPANFKPHTISDFIEKRAEISGRNIDIIREAIKLSASVSDDAFTLEDDSHGSMDEIEDFLLSIN